MQRKRVKYPNSATVNVCDPQLYRGAGLLHWLVHFQTLHPFENLPQLTTISSETQYEPSYHHEGRFREEQQHCIFKYTLKGEGVLRDALGAHRVSEGCGFLARVSDPQMAYYYPDDTDVPWTFVWIAFCGETAMKLVEEMIGRYGSVYELPRSASAMKRISAYQSYDGVGVEVTAAEGADLVMSLLLTLTNGKEQARKNDPDNVMVRMVQECVREHLEENINVSDLARSLKISREHLSRVFREVTGVTPHKYILRQKMQLACRLLKESTLTGKEISVRLGYADPAQFTRSFKSLLHMTPGQFREVGAIPVL